MSTSQKTATESAARPAAPEPPEAAVALDAHWAATRERLRNRKPATAVLRICDDEELKDARDEAVRNRRLAAAALDSLPSGDARAQAQGRLDRAEEALQRAQAAVDDATITLTFRGLPRPEFEDLIKAHPPTEQEAEEGGQWNVETFTPALVSAASADGMPIEDAVHYLTTWSNGEANDLFNAAMSVQRTSRLELGKG